MQRIVTFLLMTVFLLPAAAGADKPARWRVVWRVSQALLTGASAADAASSWGKNEANPLLRTTQRFSYGSLALKLGAVAGGLTVQHYIVRKAPYETPLFATANLAVAGMLSAVAAHNMNVPAAK